MRLIRNGKANKNIRHNSILVVIVVASTILVGGFAGVALALNDHSFTPGVSIGGVDLSGVGLEQAQAMVSKSMEQRISQIKMPIVIQNKTVLLNANDLGISSDADKVLKEAFEFNKNNADSFSDRFDKSVQLAQGKSYKVSLTVDENKLTRTLEELAQKYDIQPVDAQAVFDKELKSFQFIEGKNGKEMNIPAIVKMIEERVSQGDFSELYIQSEIAAPALTVDQLKAATSLIGFCKTNTTSESNRNKNIQLVCDVLDGQVIGPNQILSINTLVGERTEDKGFKMAPAIIDGTLSDQVGGGICQVAGTLYNAALLANMKIVERVHHTWPSSYLPIGLDATLNWDDKDLKIQNTTDLPIYISATFENQTVQIQLYGKPLADGILVTIENDIVEKEDPPASDVIYTNLLPPGTQKTQISSRKGYTVDIYRIFSQNGSVIKKELISKDSYLAIKGVILAGTAAQQK